MNNLKELFNNYSRLPTNVNRATMSCVFTKTVCSRYLNHIRRKSDGTKIVLLNSYSKVGILTAYLLKKKNLFSEICLYEPCCSPTIEGTVEDLNNITKTSAHVTYHIGKRNLIPALKHANIVVMLEKYSQLCFEPSNKCKTPLDLAAEISNKAFIKNAEYCAKMAEAYAKICPSALFVDTVKPINSTLPLVCRVAARKNHNVDTSRILGCTTMDVVAANLLWARNAKTKLENAKVPVVGGSSAYTAVPLFSQIKLPEKKKKVKVEEKPKEVPKKEQTDEQKKEEEAKKNKEKEEMAKLVKKLTAELRKGNETLLLDPTAPLATAAAIAKFIISLGTALRGHEVKEYAYVQSNLIPNVRYLAGPIEVGPAGVQKVIPLPKLSEYEKILLESAAYYLVADIQSGEDFAEKYLVENECG